MCLYEATYEGFRLLLKHFFLFICRISLICSDLKLSEASVYHEKAAGEVYISELEQAMYVFSWLRQCLSGTAFPTVEKCCWGKIVKNTFGILAML